MKYFTLLRELFLWVQNMQIGGDSPDLINDKLIVLAKISSDDSVPAAWKNKSAKLADTIKSWALNGADPKSKKRIVATIVNLNKALDGDNLEETAATQNSQTQNLEQNSSTEEIDGIPDYVVEFLDKFVQQQVSQLDDFETQVLAFEKGDSEALEWLKRFLHTLKGDFGVLGLNYYAQLIHSIEEALNVNQFSSDQFLRLKDFLMGRYQSFLDKVVPPILDSELSNLFEQVHSDIQALNSKVTLNSFGKSETKTTLKKYLDNDNKKLDSLQNDSGLLLDFFTESGEYLDASDLHLVELKSNPKDKELLNTLFRASHTIKGVAGFLNLKIVSTFAHHLESFLSKLRESDAGASAGDVTLMIRAFDALRSIMDVIKQNFLNHSPVSVLNEWDEVYHILSHNGQENSIIEAPDELKEESLEPNDLILNIDFVAPTIVPEVSPEVSKKVAPSETQRVQKLVDDSIRVSTFKLDQLIDAIGETVIAQSMIAADKVIQSAEDLMLEKKLAQSNLLIRQIQELSMSLRMIPVQGTFQKMARIIRDLSKKTGKQVDFVTSGDDTELDKTVVEKIADPLMHMVRNSVDHGIELPEERKNLGKNGVAKVCLRAFNRGGSIFIEVEDDGRGLDKDRILQKALNKGLCKPDDLLSDQDIYKFIFHPGFSTAAQVTDISGRGVGMDVVKKNIESLRGSININTIPGQKTVFSIRLPLTLAIIDGMNVRVQDQFFIIPTLSMIETVRLEEHEVVNTYDDSQYIRIRERLVPIVSLNLLLGFQNNKDSEVSGVVVIVEDMVGNRLGLFVDEILGQQQTVIKNMGEWIGEIEGVAGGAIMNNGCVSLILDVGGLISLFNNVPNKGDLAVC